MIKNIRYLVIGIFLFHSVIAHTQNKKIETPNSTIQSTELVIFGTIRQNKNYSLAQLDSLPQQNIPNL